MFYWVEQIKTIHEVAKNNYEQFSQCLNIHQNQIIKNLATLNILGNPSCCLKKKKIKITI